MLCVAQVLAKELKPIIVECHGIGLQKIATHIGITGSPEFLDQVETMLKMVAVDDVPFFLLQ